MLFPPNWSSDLSYYLINSSSSSPPHFSSSLISSNPLLYFYHLQFISPLSYALSFILSTLLFSFLHISSYFFSFLSSFLFRIFALSVSSPLITCVLNVIFFFFFSLSLLKLSPSSLALCSSCNGGGGFVRQHLPSIFRKRRRHTDSELPLYFPSPPLPAGRGLV